MKKKLIPFILAISFSIPAASQTCTSAIYLRAEKGSALSWMEVDSNFLQVRNMCSEIDAAAASPANTVTVCSAGCDYTSVKTAVDYVATQSPGIGNKWIVRVGPGTFTESAPFDVPAYTTVEGVGNTFAAIHDSSYSTGSESTKIVFDTSFTAGYGIGLNNTHGALRNLYVNHSSSVTLSGDFQLIFMDGSNTVIDGCSVVGGGAITEGAFRYALVQPDTNSNSTIKNSTISLIGGDGATTAAIYIAGASPEHHLQGSYVWSSGNAPAIYSSNAGLSFFDLGGNTIRAAVADPPYDFTTVGGTYISLSAATSYVPGEVLTTDFVGNALDTELLFSNAGTVDGSVLTTDGTNITLASGQLLLPDGTAAAPAMAFNDNAGVWQPSGNTIALATSGGTVLSVDANSISTGQSGNGPSLRAEIASQTNPTLVPQGADDDSGIGGGSGGHVTIVSNGSNIVDAYNDATSNQVVVKGSATQAADVFVVEDSGGVDDFRVDTNGDSWFGTDGSTITTSGGNRWNIRGASGGNSTWLTIGTGGTEYFGFLSALAGHAGPVLNLTSAASINMGANAASIITGEFGSGTDGAAWDLTLAGGAGTGTGAGGSVLIQTAAPGGTGASLNALATVAEFTDGGQLLLPSGGLDSTDIFWAGTTEETRYRRVPDAGTYRWYVDGGSIKLTLPAMTAGDEIVYRYESDSTEGALAIGTIRARWYGTIYGSVAVTEIGSSAFGVATFGTDASGNFIIHLDAASIGQVRFRLTDITATHAGHVDSSNVVNLTATPGIALGVVSGITTLFSSSPVRQPQYENTIIGSSNDYSQNYAVPGVGAVQLAGAAQYMMYQLTFPEATAGTNNNSYSLRFKFQAYTTAAIQWFDVNFGVNAAHAVLDPTVIWYGNQHPAIDVVTIGWDSAARLYMNFGDTSIPFAGSALYLETAIVGGTSAIAMPASEFSMGWTATPIALTTSVDVDPWRAWSSDHYVTWTDELVHNGGLTVNADGTNAALTVSSDATSNQVVVKGSATQAANFLEIVTSGGAKIQTVNTSGDTTTTGNFISDVLIGGDTNGLFGAAGIYWANTTTGFFVLYPGIMDMRYNTTQQNLRIHNTYTDASNYERMSLTGASGTGFNITAETAGTGADNLDITLTPAGTGNVNMASGQLLLPDGTAAATALSFSSDTTDFGMYRHAAGYLALVSGSGNEWYFQTNGYFASSSSGGVWFKHDGATATAPTVGADAANIDTGIGGVVGSDTLTLVAGAQDVLTVDNDATSNQVLVKGSATQVGDVFVIQDSFGQKMTVAESNGTFVVNDNLSSTADFFVRSQSWSNLIWCDASGDICSYKGTEFSSAFLFVPTAGVSTDHGAGSVSALTDIGDLCAGTQILQRNAGDTAWECIATPGGGGGGTPGGALYDAQYNDGAGGFAAGHMKTNAAGYSLFPNLNGTNPTRGLMIGDVDPTGAAPHTGDGTIAIGYLALTGSSTGSVALGYSAQAYTQGSVAIGYQAYASRDNGEGSNVAIGYQAQIDTTQDNSVVIGYQAKGDGTSVTIGRAADVDDLGGVAIGDFATVRALSAFGIAIGKEADVASDDDYSIALGYDATTTGKNQMQVGSNVGPVYDFYWGGTSVGTTQPIGFHIPYDTGTNQTSAANWSWTVGQGTGTGTSADLIWNYAPSGTTGSTVHTPTEGLRFKGDTGILLATVPHGELYEDNATGSVITLTTGGSFYGWQTATAGEAAGISNDVADATADHLTIDANMAGVYMINAQVSFSGTVSALIQCYIFDTGVKTHLGFTRKLGTGGDVGTANASGLYTVAAADEISLRCSALNDTKTITVYNVNLTARKLGS